MTTSPEFFDKKFDLNRIITPEKIDDLNENESKIVKKENHLIRRTKSYTSFEDINSSVDLNKSHIEEDKDVDVNENYEDQIKEEEFYKKIKNDFFESDSSENEEEHDLEKNYKVIYTYDPCGKFKDFFIRNLIFPILMCYMHIVYLYKVNKTNIITLFVLIEMIIILILFFIVMFF